MASRSINEEVYFSENMGGLPTSHQNGAPAQRVKRKRHRVPVACFNCRALKTKCDGSKPVCSTCASNGDNCQYSPKGISTNSTVVMVNQQYLRSLEERLAKLEQGSTQDSVGDHTSPYSDMTVLPQTPARGAMNLSYPDLEGITPPARNHPFSAIHPSLITATSTENPLLVSADPDVFMGGVSFTQLILNAMNGRTLDLRPTPFPSQSPDASFPASTIYHLPHEAPDLIRQFFDINHTVSPIFHEPSIRASFEDAINSPLSERHNHRATLALLNMIFAVCLSHRLMDKNTNPAISRHYYDIAMTLLTPDLLHSWHISKVQALLLGARYLQCSNSPDECWNVLGLAIRIAHGLELHRAPPDTDPCHEKEVKKRVWWACFSLDKLLSMIYGRPAAISALAGEFTCPLPLDLDDECIFADRVLYPSPRRASSMSFSIEVAKLYRILEAATRSADFETVGVGGGGGEALAQSVLVLDERFQRWYADVPRELKLDENEDEAAEKPLILALRANMVRILIHRPSLALSLRALSTVGGSDRRSAVNEGVKSSILMHSRHICVGTAMETVGLIGRRHEQTRRKSGTSWFNLYYLFNAILILVSHVLDPAYHNDRACLAQLETALTMIKAMSSNHTFAQKAYSFLQQLLSCMDKSLPMTAHLLRPIPGSATGTGTGSGTPTANQRLGPGIGGAGMPGLGGGAAAGMDGFGRTMDGMGRNVGGPAGAVDEELFAGLFDFTQDLSETYADIGSEMSAWFDEQAPVGYARIE